jgi:multidrug efflux pump
MNISAPFIKRPVATTLMMLAIILAGMTAFKLLPVAPLPQVDFPTISVSASLPGASPETMAATVATPLERSLGRIAGVTEMTSSSSLGFTRITLQFDLSRNIDGAANDVQAAINAARSLLPSGLPSNPTYRKVNPADSPIMVLALTSETIPRAQMYDAAATILAQKIAQSKGIGQVIVGGSSLPAVRVEVNPTLMSALGVGFEDVRTAIVASNTVRPKGQIESGERSWQVVANDTSSKAKDYIPVIIGYRNGAPVRVGDVAQVVDSVEDLRNGGLANGKPAILLVMWRQPGANIIDTVEGVRALLPQLKASIPAAIDMAVALDRTPTIRASLKAVETTLIISVLLVVMVVFLFLGNMRATVIPSIAVPVSLIGTFAAMYLCGFSLNNLSLMALTIATGFVVDDAIVVLEIISRRIENGEPPFTAALQGAKEVGFTVISISISLVAVFIPILLMGGIVGRLFREFAATLSVAIAISLLISLTATPMLCARLLKNHILSAPKGYALRIEQFFKNINQRYATSLAYALDHKRLMMLMLFSVIGLNIYLYITIPKGFFPPQDTGRVIGFIQADQSISFQAMQKKMAQFMQIVMDDPAVDKVVSFNGGGQTNTGSLFISLKPLTERKMNVDNVIARIRGKLNAVAGASLYLVAVSDIRMGGRPSNAQYQFTLLADNLDELQSWGTKIRFAMSDLPELVDVNTDAQDKGIQTTLTINHDDAAKLGLTTNLIDTTLNDAFGQRQISTIYNPLNQYHVVMEAAPQYTQNPASLQQIYISKAAPKPNSYAVGAAQSLTAATIPIGAIHTPGAKVVGGQVPLTAIATYKATNTPLAVNHQGQFIATTISFNLPPNVSLGQASDAIYAMMDKLQVPNTVRGSFQGTAKAFQDSLSSQPLLILAAFITVYIVLGILYESLIHPITILSTLPSAGVGALLALMLCNTEFSIIALIGVILLIGIVKKNAIMMVDFAVHAQRTEGLSAHDAIYKACLRRFRPIMMTTMAAILGAIPLALGTGDGAELNRPLGISIVGGLIVSQILTLYTTPVVYLYMERLRERQWFRK